MDKKRLLLTLCPIYLFFFMGDAILSSYYSLYFIHRGLDAMQQSILLGLIPFCLFLGCFLISALSKTPRRTIWLFRICAGIETGLTFGFAFCTNFTSLAILTALLAFFNGAPFALIEAHSILAIEGKNIRYGTIRIFGTLGYIVSLFAGYFLLSNLPFEDCYYFSAGFFALGFLFSFFSKPASGQSEEESSENAEPFKPNKRAVVLLVLAMVLINGALFATTYLLPIRLKSLGMEDADYSMIRSVGIAVEAGSMLLVPFLYRFFPNRKFPFYIAAAGFALAIALVIFITDPFACGYVNLVITGVVKAFLYAYQMYFFEEVAGKKNLSRVFTIQYGLYNLLASVMNLLSSTIYLNVGFGVLFGILAGLEVTGFVVLLFIPAKKEKEPNPTEEGVN